MNSSLKNIITLLVIAIFAFVGYYIFTQGDVPVDQSENSYVTPEMMASTQLFIERRTILDSVSIDLSVLENHKFVSYRDLTLPVSIQEIGRQNPFDEADKSQIGENIPQNNL